MVLHHHDNDVIDLADPLGRGRRYPIRAGACGEGREHRKEEAVVLSRGESIPLIRPAAPVRILHPASPKIARSKHLRSSNQPSGAGAQEHSRVSGEPPVWVAVCPGALGGYGGSCVRRFTHASLARGSECTL